MTIKDHRDDFRVKPKYRLLNPTKSESGKISRHILQQISPNIRTTLNMNSWQDSSEVIKWFKNSKNKNLHTFTVFNIQEFYPSIGRKDIEVIFHCRRSLLFHDNEPWIKKDSNGDFDVAMGSYDGTEVYELAEFLS